MREQRRLEVDEAIDDAPFYDDTDLAVLDLIHGPGAHPRRSSISDKTWAELEAYLRVRDRGPSNPTCYVPVYVGGCRWRYVHESKWKPDRPAVTREVQQAEPAVDPLAPDADDGGEDS